MSDKKKVRGRYRFLVIYGVPSDPQGVAFRRASFTYSEAKAAQRELRESSYLRRFTVTE